MRRALKKVLLKAVQPEEVLVVAPRKVLKKVAQKKEVLKKEVLLSAVAEEEAEVAEAEEEKDLSLDQKVESVVVGQDEVALEVEEVLQVSLQIFLDVDFKVFFVKKY